MEGRTIVVILKDGRKHNCCDERWKEGQIVMMKD
jgi:hypothetical protein